MLGSIESGSAQQPTKIRYWVLSGFCAAAAIAYIQRYSINLFAPSIQDDLSLDKDQMGSVMSGFFAGYALMQIPAAWLGDRWGSRHALTLYAVTWSLATALMAAASNLDSLVAVWTLMGMAQAGLFPCAIIGLRDWQPITLRTVASGMLSTFMNVGAVLAPLLAGWLLIRYTLARGIRLVVGAGHRVGRVVLLGGIAIGRTSIRRSMLTSCGSSRAAQRLSIPRRISNHERRGCDCSSTIGCG